MSRPRADVVRDHDVDRVTSPAMQHGLNSGGDAAGRGGLAASLSPLHLACVGVLALVVADVAITALPALRHAAFRVVSSPRGGRPPERRARLRETIADRALVGDYRSAIELATELVADLKSELNAAHAAGAVNVLEAGDMLAGLHLKQGDHGRAETLYRQHLEILETTRTPASWAGAGVPEVLCKLGGVRAARGDDAGAESLYRRALTMCDAYSSDHPFTCDILDALAAVCRRTDRDAEAGAFEARARSIRVARATRATRTPDGGPRP